MKINNNILYKIFFYLLIILFFIFIFTNKLVEPYNNINILLDFLIKTENEKD